MRTILVTGGTGFIGNQLIPAILNAGCSIYATYHSIHPDEHEYFDANISWVKHELGSSLADHSWFSSIDTIVHMAGLAHKVGHGSPAYENIYRANVNGTEQLVQDALEHNVKKFIFISTVKVHGEYTSAIEPVAFNEASPYDPQDDYAKCKVQAEQIIIKNLKCCDCNYLILRPPLIYGPGVKANFFKLMTVVEKGWPLPLASLSQKRSMLFVQNLVDVIVKCIHSQHSKNQAFVFKDVDISTANLISSLASSMGKSIFMFPMSNWILDTACKTIGLGQQYEKIAKPLLIDDAKSRELLGWKPKYSFQEGIKSTVDWYTSLLK